MEKFIWSLVGFWLLCGAAASFNIVDRRPLTPGDVVLGPFSLADEMR